VVVAGAGRFVVRWLARIARSDRAGVEGRSRDPRAGRAAPHWSVARLQGTINPFIAHETFTEIKDKPLADKVRIMRDPSFRARMLAETEARQSHPLARRVMAFDRIFPLGDPPNYEPPKETSLEAMAARGNREAQDIAYDMLLED